jgi:catalase (peroxidase I)
MSDPNCALALIKLAWHSSGTYNNYSGGGDELKEELHFKRGDQGGKQEGDGLRFKRALGGNAVLALTAMPWMDKIKEKVGPSISFPDLYTLGGVVAIECLGGPKIRWRAGRKDRGEERAASEEEEEGRGLPESCVMSNDADQLRCMFQHMRFEEGERDRAIVALSGAHALGRLAEGEGAGGTATFNNAYFVLLSQMKKKRGGKREWDGPSEFETDTGDKIMLMPTDIALINDPAFFKWVNVYAKDTDKFFSDFTVYFQQLTETGCKDLAEVAV